VSELTFDKPYYLEIDRARWAVAAQVIAELRRTLPGGLRTCLDVGCGPGWFSEKLAQTGLTVTGAEGRAELVAEARRRVPQVRFQHVDVESEERMRDLGFFDLSFCFGLLYHVELRSTTMASIAKVRGGPIIRMTRRPAGHSRKTQACQAFEAIVAVQNSRSPRNGQACSARVFDTSSKPRIANIHSTHASDMDHHALLGRCVAGSGMK